MGGMCFSPVKKFQDEQVARTAKARRLARKSAFLGLILVLRQSQTYAFQLGDGAWPIRRNYELAMVVFTLLEIDINASVCATARDL